MVFHQQFGGGSSNQIMGAKKTTDFLEKTTWTLAIVLISLTMLSNFAITRNFDSTNEIKSQEQIDEAIIPQNLPEDNPLN